MTVHAKIAPASPGAPRLVVHPDTRRPFPDGVFVLTDGDLANPRIRRLFAPAGTPGGLPGGIFGDLLVADLPDPTPLKRTK